MIHKVKEHSETPTRRLNYVLGDDHEHKVEAFARY